MENYQQNLEEQFKQYEGLVYFVLKRKGIYHGNSEFEDWAQELRIHLFQLLVKFHETNTQLEYPKAYLIRALEWQLSKLIRQQYYRVDEVHDDLLIENGLSTESEYTVYEFMASLPKTLSVKETMLLEYLLNGYSLKEIAKLCHCQYRTIVRWRKKLIEHLKSHGFGKD
ncbi:MULTISPECIES: sigma-70 family RNA polymerase sigma factor [unclassified Facklamia]|uniref:sigma-70 family RNA polymerase sigma factor n=1 Tax=Aerococcaceae TaxID=186827 RepID=UPI0013D46384|nr:MULTISPECIES: sigma-70 family RNA polymerase sigma factor [unclassified Facklamia]MBS4461060.1 sigma-70 family RNA polymerase sigma factor [Aerococcaceae bacterium zg-B36]QQD64907.1 sigma-70 family RNA polymerase sigma factor [Aerococcaceae bacterium zg-252]